MSVLWINPYRLGAGSGGGPGGGSSAASAFASDGATNPIYGNATWPAAFYAAATDTTVFFREAFYNGERYAVCVTYDHGSDTWSDDYPVARVSDWLTNDDHGVPAGFRDAGGFLHWFGGAHNAPMRHYVSKAADDITGWDAQAALGSTYAYPHPVYDGTTLFLFLRKLVGGTDYRGALLRSTAIAGGVVTFGAEVEIVSLSGRFYLGNTYDDGSYIHLIATRADTGDNFRQNIYHFRYEKSSGDLLNADGTHTTAAASLPVTLAAADTYYRIVDQSTPGHFTNVPTVCADNSGSLHLVYMDGATANGTSWDLRHMIWALGSWSSPTTIVSLTHCSRFTEQGVGPLSAGGVELLYPDNDGTYTRGGIAIRRTVYAGGSWGAPTTIGTDTNGKGLDRPSRILSGEAVSRMQYWEVAQDANDSSAGGLVGYVYGTTGLVARSIPTHDLQVVGQYSFDGANGATKTYDDSMFAPKFTPTFGGNAQISTAQQKFGAASLLLDGSGDYLQFANGGAAAMSAGNTTDKCFECWIYPTSLAHALNTIFNKRNSGGGASEFTLVVQSNGSMQLVGWNGNVVKINITSAAAVVVTNAWQHIAATRESGLWRIFVGGTLVVSGSESGTLESNGTGLIIGKDNFTAGREFTGHIDEVRIIHGRAEYTAAFTPPAAAFARP